MKLETPRLTIPLLSLEQLRLWRHDLTALEGELSCRYRGESLSGFMGGIVDGQIKKLEADPENPLYHSFFWLLRRDDGTVVGSADFKAPPNEKGELEIGYGLGLDYRGQGYMSEAVEAMCAFALARDGIRAITAETERENRASENVLSRCAFSLWKDKEETRWWRRER